jgi:hypothetical protein
MACLFLRQLRQGFLMAIVRQVKKIDLCFIAIDLSQPIETIYHNHPLEVKLSQKISFVFGFHKFITASF